ncbi:hypothetical protein PHMEG_00015390 [Phytophthora megakarya]|uniref:DDE Tnp4 domain-containing protein n=1 Tax=Phytophthora megakarya TaxID=4795 RepID=A0A225W3Z0_9STRA|nr:hypothetical protein PHMEG_00015390 [Phytophthora megakarya]
MWPRSRRQKHEQVVRLLGLTTLSGQRFFEAIFNSQNKTLFRDLFQAYQPHIRHSLSDQRDVLAVVLHWIGTAATCRSQEVLIDLAYSTVHQYCIHGAFAIVRGQDHLISIPTAVPNEFKQRHPYFDQAPCAIDGTHFNIVVSKEDSIRFRNHKGFISTNVRIACDWTMRLCYIFPGADGSAPDSMILHWSRFLNDIPEKF